MLTTESSWLKYIILTSLFPITFVGNYQNRDLAVNKVFLEGGKKKKQNDTILVLITVTVELPLLLLLFSTYAPQPSRLIV
jgi:hypothetical protein